MKFANILFAGSVLVEGTQSHLLEQEHLTFDKKVATTHAPPVHHTTHDAVKASASSPKDAVHKLAVTAMKAGKTKKAAEAAIKKIT